MSDLSNPATFHGVPIRHTCTGCGEVMNCDHYPPGTRVNGDISPLTPGEAKQLSRYKREDELDRKVGWLLVGGAVTTAFFFFTAVILQRLGLV
jgi:hypothetical protein